MSSGTETRSIELESVVDAPAEEVWEILTTAEGLRQWFPLDASVEPTVGGTVWLSWGPGCEGKAPIHIWEPPSRMGWTESYGDDEAGRPIKVAVDFYVEARGGTTVVRLVQSGLNASSDWDEMYDALEDGWTYFLFSLAYYFLKHRGKKRTLVWKRVATELGRDALWDRLVGGALIGAVAAAGSSFRLSLDRGYEGEIVSQRPGHYFTGTLPSLDDSVIFVEIEGPHVGFWLSTYGLADARSAELQAALDRRIEEALGSP